MPSSLLILGASTRAAAFSALSAGLAPVCADQFADLDLAGRCPATAIADYPQGLVRFAKTAPEAPWMYTGGLENHPALVDTISASRPLLGNSGAVLNRVRDPFAVARVLQSTGFDVPEVRETAAGLPRDGTWLRKSARTSGGLGVAPLTHVATGTQAPRRGAYFQRRVAGQPAAAVFLAAKGNAVLLGATEQLLRARPGEEAAFQYAGSLGPLRLDEHKRSTLAEIGRTLAAEFRLSGLFGVDYIDDAHSIWPVEVNPRYTASIEILERGCLFSAVGWHVAACRDGVLPADEPTADRHCHAKRIIYAAADLEISAAFERQATEANADWQRPTVADIPAAATRIPAGRPVMTVFAAASGPAEARAALERACQSWETRLDRE